jgi:hypothetical protein
MFVALLLVIGVILLFRRKALRLDLKLGVRRVLGISLITLLMLEVALRLVMGGAEVGSLYQFRRDGLNDGRCVGLKPGAQLDFTGVLKRIPPVRQEVNGLGYRGLERSRSKSRGVFRVGALGDSYTYGQDVTTTETLPAQLEVVLADLTGQPTEVLNFGIGGAQLEDLVPQAQYFVSQWHPDLIVYFMHWNDLDTSLCAWTSGFRFRIASLSRHVYLLRLLRVLSFSRQRPQGSDNQSRGIAFRARIRELRDVSRSMGANLAIVVLGDPVEPPAKQEVNHPSPALIKTMTEFNILWLDARAWMGTNGGPAELPRIPWDFHLTPGANREAAARVARWLIASHLVPTRVGDLLWRDSTRSALPTTPVTLPLHVAVGDSTARRWLQSGWGKDESSGGRSYVWSIALQSVLMIPLPRKRNIQMAFEVLPFVFPSSPPQVVSIILNGIVVQEVALRPELAKYSVVFPAKALVNGLDTLEFRYAYARSPRAVLSTSGDDRPLAVAWYSIDFAVEEP